MSVRHQTVPEPLPTEELFVDFANTLAFDRGGPRDALPTIGALLAWLADHGVLTPRTKSTEAARLRNHPREVERRLADFRETRDLVHDIAQRLSGGQLPSAAQVRAVNAVLRSGSHYHQLALADDEERYTYCQVGDQLENARAAIAGSMAHFLADHDPYRLRACANQGCRWLFIDRSPAGRRRWCDMRTCGNQAKVRRHRARARNTALGRAVNTSPAGSSASAQAG
jgi:predicted RNA-binding Zn ribbon-like protein